MTYRAGIFGASGLVGSRLLDQLLEDPACTLVRAFVRDPLRRQHPKLEVVRVDFEDLAASGNLLALDRLFCCLGTTIRKAGNRENFKKIDRDLAVKIGRIAIQVGASHFSVISSFGAHPKSSSFYLRTKAEMEAQLLGMPFKCLHIFRPSLLLGDREEFRAGEKIAASILSRMAFLLPKRLRPVPATLVAKAIWAASSSEYDKKIFESEALQCGSKITRLLEEDSARQSGDDLTTK